MMKNNNTTATMPDDNGKVTTRTAPANNNLNETAAFDDLALREAAPPAKAIQRKTQIDAPEADQPKTLSPVDQLYVNFTDVFGNDNPRQLFSMVWPGTVLDYGSYKIPDGTTQGFVPVSIQINQSTLFDQYYPIATITQPDGTRVSDRYTQALEIYGPKPNEALIDLQQAIRDRLDQKIEMVVDGVVKNVTLLEKFSILEDEFVTRKQDWGKMKADKLQSLKDGGDEDWWEQYLTWYGLVAQGYIDGINAAYNRMVADFPLSEFEDALAILDTHDAAALLRAKQDIRNAQVPAPPEVGASYYPTLAVPHDWGSVLKPSTTFRDLLAAPDAQKRFMDNSIEQLQKQILAWQAVLAQIPDTSKAEIAAALDGFSTASTEYYGLSNELINTYTDNTVMAVQTFLDLQQGTDQQKVDGANKMREDLNVQNGGSSPIITPELFAKIAGEIGVAQKKLVGQTGSMVESGQNLARKATAYLDTKAGEGLKQLIQPVISQLQSQLEVVVKQVANFNSAATRAIALNTPPVVLNGADDKDPELTKVAASVADSLSNLRWSEITLEVSKSSMTTQSQTSTSFSQTNWGVDFFFGSAGGQNQEAAQKFASEYMADTSNIQIGMLATKVLIERPWMHPEIFSMTKKFFKALDMDITAPRGDSIASKELMPEDLGGTVSQQTADDNCINLNKGILPGYPVAVLLAKDITIKIKLSANKTTAMQAHSESNESNGGGFLCFSVSKTQSSSSDSKSASSYAMGGDYVFRIPAPQVIGVWNQILPPDESTFLKSDDIKRVLKFKSGAAAIKNAIKNRTAPEQYSEEPPTRTV
jgi:hypothetical protein